MRVVEHESLEELQAVTKRERDGRVRLRLQGVVLARQGRSARVIGQSLGVSPRPARAWVRRSNQGGSAALQEPPGRGRRGRLNAAPQQRLCAGVDVGAQADDGVCSLRGLDLVRGLQEEHGPSYSTSYSTSGVYGLLKRLGYSSLVPRPRHRQADAVAQSTFKKT